ncbi:hypothetical protein [Acidovorax sp. NB1]|uniref:hypothetical protein n=1 Tax=Acidovorax sp. NB1 TaxID=1943571 RepID=UPI0010D09037|nr:hypothetical protein [Acidovorax sp. NB1]GDY37209.1 hypothetical protein ACINB_31010 [Acidovorax sp. NB1]
MKDQILHPDSAVTAKNIVNWLAAFLGLGTFLGVVNLAVGVLSAAWLGVQIYGYLAHELPMKRMRKQMLKRDLERGATQPAELGADK